MNFNKEQPYNDLPLLPPDFDVENKSILKKVNESNKALAELKGIERIIPNPNVILNSIVLKEAKSSSEIENIVTTNDKLYEAISLDSINIDHQTKEVLNYRSALWKGISNLKINGLITTNTFIRIVNDIKDNELGIRNVPGTKIANSKGVIIYTPPEGFNVISDKLANLEQFINIDDDGIDPLIKMAIIHYQFESIHPFIDGNGRTGRVLNILYLIQKGLINNPILYLSKFIIENKDKYYLLLRKVTENKEWEPWINYMLDGIRISAIESKLLILDIYKLMEETAKEAQDKMIFGYSKELIAVVFENLYCRIVNLVSRGIAERETASKYLYELERIGIMEKRKVGKNNLFINKKLFDLLSK